MHKCPHCDQEFEAFAFYCIRCRNVIGKVKREGELLAVWWTDRSGEPSERFKLKTLKRDAGYVNVKNVSPEYPAEGSRSIIFTLDDNQETPLSQTAREFFDQASSDTEEWTIS